MKRSGRPPLPRDERRTVHVMTSLTPTLAKKLKEVADREERSVAYVVARYIQQGLEKEEGR
jgi:hypothetical protein